MTTGSSYESTSGHSSYSEEPAEHHLVNVEVTTNIARRIGDQWKWLGREMGVEDVKLNNIEADYRGDREEMAYQMLLVWKETRSQGATINVLVQHLKQVGRVDLATEILQMPRWPTTKGTIHEKPLILQTEKRSLDRSGLQEKRSSVTSTSQEELNRTWASLKSTLQMEHKRKKIPSIPWLKDWELNFEDYYVDLILKHKNDIETTPLQLHEIFKSKKGNILTCPRILIEGAAGYGKSTLACKLCFDHAKGENYVGHFEAVILIHLRDFVGTLEEMIVNSPQLNDFTAEQVIETIQKFQDKILFVLDGFDELHPDNKERILPLLKGNQLPQATVIVTSREGYIKLESEASNSSVSNLLHCMDRRILIKGLTKKNRIRFLQLYLKGYTTKKYDSVLKSLHHLTITPEERLFECPLFLLLLVIVSEQTDMASLNTKTDLYKCLFNFILCRTKVKENQTDQTYDFFDFNADNPPSYVKLLTKFGSLSGEALVNSKCSFTEEEILAVCGNDRSILKLGILRQNDSKTGRTRNTWYEPIHLSFLDFTFAYHIWVSIVRLPNTFYFSWTTSISNMLKLMRRYGLVIPFLCGLCGKHLSTLVSVAMHYDFESLKNITLGRYHRDFKAESKLKPYELVKAVLPLFPINYVIDWSYSIESLKKESLKHAAETRKNQRIILIHKSAVDSDHCETLPLRLPPVQMNLEVSQDWCELLTNQILDIYHPLVRCCKFAVTICEAPLDEQLSWLSNFMTIEGLFADKPLYKVKYWCPESQLAKTFNEIAELIRQEKVIRVVFKTFPNCILPREQWKEFICCANQSKELLDMKLYVHAESPLFINLGSAEGKRWRIVKLGGSVVPLLQSQLNFHNEPNTWNLNSFIREMPTIIHAFLVDSNIGVSCAFIQDDSSSIPCNVHELYIKVGNNASLTSCIWKQFKNLQVLAIGLTADFSMIEYDIITSVLAVVSHCYVLVRLELWHGFTEELMAAFLRRLAEERYPVISKHGEHKMKDLHLDTLMLSPFISSEKDIPKRITVKLLKEQLQSGVLRHLWIGCNKHAKGYTKQEFMELFSPAEGFTCNVTQESREENDNMWKLVNFLPMLIYKISANYKVCLKVPGEVRC